ncbi:MAG: hypothetical protein U9Q05_00015 [Thermodesulfobacteriota bacterium]|nr:hypothetical protein [Thermodesulfobacteriota bacterium]
MKKNRVGEIKKWIIGLILGVLLLGWLVSCSPYASVDIGTSFKVGPFHVNPRIGVGSFL